MKSFVNKSQKHTEAYAKYFGHSGKIIAIKITSIWMNSIKTCGIRGSKMETCSMNTVVLYERNK
jgi:hypothetical protein